MKMMRFAVGALAAVALATVPALVSASDEAPTGTTAARAVSAAAQAAPVTQFAALKAIDAAPMSSDDLKAVKGLHVHFIEKGNGFSKFHLAGDVKTENNWSNQWGGTDGVAVAPSYKGLCVAHSVGGIFIPTMGPITTQRPAR